MEGLWEGSEPVGAKLSQDEWLLLWRLAGKLSLDELRKKGFTDEEAKRIQGWYTHDY